MKKKMTKVLFIFLGSLFFVLGAIGVILPLLPTTPFLLLSAYFYLRSSEKLYNWLLNHRLFGLYIYSYIHFRAIDLKTKVTAISMLWITLIISMIIVQKLWVSLLLVAIGLSVTLHLLSLKTMSKKSMTEARDQHRQLSLN